MIKLPDCDICNNKRHVRKGKYFPPCECLEQAQRELRVRKYNQSADLKIIRYPALIDSVDKDLTIYGSKAIHPRFIAGVYKYTPLNFSIKVIDVYDLKDLDSFDSPGSLSDLTEYGLVILLVGFGPSNKRIPKLIQHVFNSRNLKGKPTWFISPAKSFSIENAYSESTNSLVRSLPAVDLNASIQRMKNNG